MVKGLYAITDPDLLPGDKLFDGVEAALKGGAKLVQYRNKNATAARQLEEAEQLAQQCTSFGARLIINDSLELCMASGAHGLHLGKSDGDIALARARLGKNRILGVTCHDDIAYAKNCRILGADYCAFGRLFDSQTKPRAPICSLDTLKRAVQEGLPVVAIGGIRSDNAEQIVRLGVSMIAVIHDLFCQDDIQTSARHFSSLFIQE